MKTQFVLLMCGLLLFTSAFAGEIPKWREDSQAMASIVSFVTSVTDEASPDYIPPERRIAVFDSDGTLTGEHFPTYFDQCLLMHRLLHDDTCTSAPQEDVVFAIALEKALLEGSPEPDAPRSTAQMCTESFKGYTVEDYRAYVRAFKDQKAVGFENMTYGEAFFVPMKELVKYLSEHGFTVFISSGMERIMLRELMADTLGEWIPPYRVIGSTISLTATHQGETAPRSYTYTREDAVLIGGDVVFKNLKMNKVVSINNEIGVPPLLVFGNSSGDFAMGVYALQHGGRAYMLLNDDTVREYGDEAGAEAFRLECESLGFEVVSMRDEFETIYGEEVFRSEEALPAA